MKQKFTSLFSGILLSGMAIAGTPVIDGVFDGESVWGAPVATGNGSAGWFNSNAKNLYVTYDANFVYFGGEFNSQTWQDFIFVVNTKDGGGRTDTWNRTIAYDHTNAPDFLFRGNIGKSNYSEFHVWNGSAWTGIGTPVNADGSNAKGLSGEASGNFDGFIEIRVPRTTIGEIGSLNVQFVIGGNGEGLPNGHGNFDSVPQDNVMTNWNAPGNFTSISQYSSPVLLPATLGSFSGNLRESAVTLNWKTLSEENLSAFYVEQSRDSRSWFQIGKVLARNAPGGSSYQHITEKFNAPVGFFRLKITDKDGKFSYSPVVVVKGDVKAKAEIIGNPARQHINVAIHAEAPEKINAEVLDMNGRRVTQLMYQHPGGSSVLQINGSQLRGGTYILRLNGEEIHETIRVVKL